MKKRAVALGYFDGLHIAHVKVLGAALEQKKNGLDPAVLLFDRHPAEVLFGADVPRLLTAADRDSILREMGVKPITGQGRGRRRRNAAHAVPRIRRNRFGQRADQRRANAGILQRHPRGGTRGEYGDRFRHARPSIYV